MSTSILSRMISSAIAGLIDCRSKRPHQRTSASSPSRLGASNARLRPTPHVSSSGSRVAISLISFGIPHGKPWAGVALAYGP